MPVQPIAGWCSVSCVCFRCMDADFRYFRLHNPLPEGVELFDRRDRDESRRAHP